MQDEHAHMRLLPLPWPCSSLEGIQAPLQRSDEAGQGCSGVVHLVNYQDVLPLKPACPGRADCQCAEAMSACGSLGIWLHGLLCTCKSWATPAPPVSAHSQLVVPLAEDGVVGVVLLIIHLQVAGEDGGPS